VEKEYAGARALLLQYFDNVDYVAEEVLKAPKYGDLKVSVGSIIEELDEVELFMNSLKLAGKAGIYVHAYVYTRPRPDGVSKPQYVPTVLPRFLGTYP
jgi:hypothetical protein